MSSTFDQREMSPKSVVMVITDVTRYDFLSRSDTTGGFKNRM
jgi:hypothetical protein